MREIDDSNLECRLTDPDENQVFVETLDGRGFYLWETDKQIIQNNQALSLANQRIITWMKNKEGREFLLRCDSTGVPMTGKRDMAIKRGEGGGTDEPRV